MVEAEVDLAKDSVGRSLDNQSLKQIVTESVQALFTPDSPSPSLGKNAGACGDRLTVHGNEPASPQATPATLALMRRGSS